MSTSIQNMILGLVDEINASVRSSAKFILKDGNFVSQIGDLYIYNFFLQDEFPFQQDANLTISVGSRTGIRGYIHELCKNSVSIASEEQVGTVLDQITITSSNSAFLQRLSEILLDLSNNPKAIPFSKKHASFVLGEGNPIATPLPSIPKDITHCTQGLTLNTEQNNAVRVGMGSEFLLLWGPPGTGKTMTIAAMLAALANSGESVLLVSNTNKAVDGALERIIQNFESLRIVEHGACLRIGQPTTGFKEKFGPKSDIKTVAAELNMELIAEQAILAEQRIPLAVSLGLVRARLQEYEAFEISQRDLAENSELAHGLQTESVPIEHSIAKLENDIFRLEAEKAKSPEIPGLLGRLGITRTRAEIDKDLKSARDALSAQRTDLRGKRNSFAVLQGKMADLKKVIQTASAAISELPTKAELESNAHKIDEELIATDNRLTEIERQIASTEQSLIDNAKVIGTTVYKAFLDQRLLKRQWDVVLVDEVSMLLLPMTYFVAGKATKRVILVGDFLQLPSIVASNPGNMQVNEWIKSDPFVKWGVTDSKIREDNPPAVFIGLREQNRMHEQLCAVISQSFYKGWLVTGPFAKNRKFCGPSIGKTDKRIMWIDTSGLNAWSSKRYGKGSLFNITHAALIGEIVDALVESGYFQGRNADGKLNSLGVVTPYAAQQDLVVTLLESMKEYVPSGSIGTAHKFQGDEKDTIIVDMVEASFKPSQFINAESYNDDAGRLLNVGLSRAKEFLILIVNKHVFERRGSRFMQSLWGRIEAVAESIDPMTLLQDSKHIDDAIDIAIGRNVHIEGKHLIFTEQDFYHAITDDIVSAHKSIVIFSAFMTIDGSTRWFAFLRKAMIQGATVQVVTKTLDKQPGANRPKNISDLSELIMLMRRSKIAVDLRSETHEKVIIIDGEIVWNGSLNMLSHRENATREHMTRTKDKNYAEEIINLLSRHDFGAVRFTVSEHPVCPSCGARTNITLGHRGRVILKCEDCCGWKVPQEAFKKLSHGIPIGKSIKSCPESGCTGDLKLRYSYGRYLLGCSNYPNCKHKEDVHVSQYQYNPFPHEDVTDLNLLSEFEEPKWLEKSKVQSTLTTDFPGAAVKIVSKAGVSQAKLPDCHNTLEKNGIPKRNPIVATTPNANSSPSKQKQANVKAKTSRAGKSKLDFIHDLADKLKLPVKTT